MQTALRDSQIDGLIAGFYRAAAGAVAWAEPLQALARCLGCWGVQLLGLKRADGSIAFSHDAGFPAEGMLHYVSHYHRIDPRTPMLAPLALGQWWHCDEHFDEAFVASHPLYQELLIPLGGRYSSGAKLYQDDEVLAIMGVHRGPAAGPLNPEERLVVQRLGGHLQIAIDLWRRQHRAQQQAFAGAAIVSRLSQPVLLVDAGLKVHHANAAAQSLLMQGAGVVVRDSRLACTAAAAQGALLLALQQLDQGAAVVAAPVSRRAVLRVGVGPGLLLMLLPLQPQETMGAFGRQQLALVLMHDLSVRRAPDPLLVSAAFALTPAEAQVACGVAVGRSPRQIASRSGVSVHTVRAQLATVFDKAGVSRQTELAAALAGLNGL